jgi:hypothetical protein
VRYFFLKHTETFCRTATLKCRKLDPDVRKRIALKKSFEKDKVNIVLLYMTMVKWQGHHNLKSDQIDLLQVFLNIATESCVLG